MKRPSESRRLLPTLLAAAAACAPHLDLDRSEPSLDTLGRGLPQGFLMGMASASHQIEGGNENDWTDWERGSFPDGGPHIRGGAQSGLAVDGWNRFAEDLAALQSAEADAYRFSIEWSRLEPSEGAWNADAMARYRSWAVALRAAHIEPMVTIQHFTLPRWIAARGGFEDPATQDALARLAERVAQELGDVVDLWCPLNEINVLAAEGYLLGEWPPGVRDDTKRQMLVMAAMLKAHAKMARALRGHDVVDADGDGAATVITHAHHVRIFQPASASPLDTAIAGMTDDVANEAIPRAFKTGRIQFFVPGTITIDEHVEGLAGSIDVLGINYYTRDMIRADLGTAAMSQSYYHPRRVTNDLGWDIYPDGLFWALTRFAAWGFPLYVTENGTPDAADTFKARYLGQHLAAVERAVRAGADVRGYFYWSLTDNFEWAEGFGPRFGLFRVDYATLARTPTRAVDTFRAIRRNVPRASSR